MNFLLFLIKKNCFRNEIQDYKTELLRELEIEKKQKRDEIAQKLKKFEDERLQVSNNNCYYNSYSDISK